MKLIPLTQGQFAKVDDADFARLSGFKWQAHWHSRDRNYRAVRREGRRQEIMARQILGLAFGDPRQADHRNGDTLDNQRHNLRAVTQAENLQNQRRHREGHLPGAHWHRRDKVWEASVRRQGKSIHLGTFSTEQLAHEAFHTFELREQSCPSVT